jgi:hypothetical protein
MAESGDNGTPTTPTSPNRSRGSSIVERVRRASVTLLDAPVPSGFFQAAGHQAATARNVNEISKDTIMESKQLPDLMRRNTITEEAEERYEAPRQVKPDPEGISQQNIESVRDVESSIEEGEKRAITPIPGTMGIPYDEPEEHLTKWEATKKALQAFWKWFLTPLVCIMFCFKRTEHRNMLTFTP